MLEAYQAYGDYDTIAALNQELVVNAARAVGRTVVQGRDGSEIDLEGEWRHASILDLVSEGVGEQITADTSAEKLREYADKHDVALQPHWGGSDILVELYEQLVEETLIQPTFVRDYPEAAKPLAKRHREIGGLSEAYDLVVNGVELVTAFSEMNDPVVQREKLVEQSQLAAQGSEDAMDLDENFLRALEFGMPPAGGMGMGIDRLMMLLWGVGIRESILFPLLRPE